MDNTILNTGDILHLAEILQAGYLPFLSLLHIIDDNIAGLEDAFEHLIEVLLMVDNRFFGNGFPMFTLKCSKLSSGFARNRRSDTMFSFRSSRKNERFSSITLYGGTGRVCHVSVTH